MGLLHQNVSPSGDSDFLKQYRLNIERRRFQLELGKWSQFKEEVVVIDSEYLASDHKITTFKVVWNPTSHVLGFSKAAKFLRPSWWRLDTKAIATTILEEAKQGLRK